MSQQLASWGDVRGGEERARRRAARPVERDVESVLLDLAETFPMLAMLVERRSGGQRKLPMGTGDGTAAQPMLLPPETHAGEPVIATPEAPPDEAPPPAAGGGEPAAGEPAPSAPQPPDEHHAEGDAPHAAPIELPVHRGRRRPTRLGLRIQFESRPADPELGRLVETTVWVNDAHPAYVRAAASRSESYHLALAVAMALAKVAVEPSQEHGFVSAFLGRWGEAARPGKKSTGKSRRK